MIEEEIKILLDFIKYIRFNEEKHYTIDKYYTAIENSVEHMRKLTTKNKEQEKIIELAIDELYLFNAYDCDYSDLKEHTCIKNDDDTVEIQKAKCKKCIREIIEKKAKGE